MLGSRLNRTYCGQLLPRGYSILYVASVYVEPRAAASQNAIKHDEKATNTIAMRIQQAIDKDPTTQSPLIFVCGDFNTAKCTHSSGCLESSCSTAASDTWSQSK